MKIYAIDYGHKKCGIAYADLSTKPWIAFPKHVVDTSLVFDFIKTKAKKEGSFLVVLGKSLNNSGKYNKIQEEINLFKKKLKNIGIKVVLFDERYTTSSANSLKRFIKNKDKRYKSIDKNSDSYAAAIILQNFLDYINNMEEKML